MTVLKSKGNSHFIGGSQLHFYQHLFNLKTFANLKIKMKKYKSGWEKEKSRRELEDKLKKVVAKSKT